MQVWLGPCSRPVMCLFMQSITALAEALIFGGTNPSVFRAEQKLT